MQKNLESTGGLIFSGQLLLELTEAGMSREDAYRLVQGHAMRAWKSDGELVFRELVEADPEITGRLSAERLAGAFDVERQLGNVDAIFARVFGAYERVVLDGETVELVGGKVRI
jgi:adenylosuccinate lyase